MRRGRKRASGAKRRYWKNLKVAGRPNAACHAGHNEAQEEKNKREKLKITVALTAEEPVASRSLKDKHEILNRNGDPKSQREEKGAVEDPVSVLVDDKDVVLRHNFAPTTIPTTRIS